MKSYYNCYTILTTKWLTPECMKFKTNEKLKIKTRLIVSFSLSFHTSKSGANRTRENEKKMKEIKSKFMFCQGHLSFWIIKKKKKSKNFRIQKILMFVSLPLTTLRHSGDLISLNENAFFQHDRWYIN